MFSNAQESRIMQVFILFFVAMITFSCGKTKNEDATVKGLRVHANFVRFNFQAYRDTPSYEELSAYLTHAITKHHGVRAADVFKNIAAGYHIESALGYKSTATIAEASGNTTPGESELTEAEALARSGVKALAADIINTANCFNLDVYYFVGLIQHESAGFNPIAESYSGAKGLTQMTGIAVKEVNHQLGQFGTEQAPQKSIDFYTKVIQNCLQVTWFPHWKDRSVSDQRENFKSNFSAALSYGAIILHEQLSVGLRGDTGDPDTAYRTAYNGYNGASAKEQAAHELGSIAAVDQFVTFVNRQRLELGSPFVINEETELLAMTGLPLESKDIVYDPDAILNMFNSSPLVAEARSLLVFRGHLKHRSGYYDSAMARAICKQIGFENPPDESQYCTFGAPMTESMWNDMQVLSNEELVELEPDAAEFIADNLPVVELYDGWKQNPEKKPLVRLLQSILKARGYPIVVDGAYGPGTQRTLISYIESANKMSFSVDNVGYDGSSVDIVIWDRLLRGKQIKAF